MKTNLPDNEKALEVLKVQGPLSVAKIAEQLSITTEGARFHLIKLEKEGLIESAKESKGRGRPKQIWSLTQKGHDRFPDTHAALTVNLIDMVRESLGEESLNQVIKLHEHKQRERYERLMDAGDSLEERIGKLTDIRTQEGYMASYKSIDEGFLFIENHCPICTAAKTCEGFCKAEKLVFEQVLGDGVSIERTEHIVKGARRCAYKITPTTP
jgi:predicted ArsR family transcriptional regulator